jgi:hypothetical protein
VATSPSPFAYVAGGLCAIALAFAPRPAQAAEPSAADRATARTLAQEGYDALRAERYSIAADRFKRADALVHAPTLLRDLARAQVGLGRLLDARQTYGQIIREGVPPKSPASWPLAVADAKREIAALEPRLASLTISVTGPAQASVTVDGEPLAASSLGEVRRVDPGRYALRATAAGYRAIEKTVALAEGETLRVALELEKEPPMAPPPVVTVARPVAPEPVKDPAWRKPALVSAFALGGAGIVVGSVTGIMAMTKHNQLVTDCPERKCGPDQESNYDDFHTLGTVSTIGFVAGGVGLGTGLVLLLLKPRAAEEQGTVPAPDRKRTARGASWSPFVGVGAAGVTGSF